VGGRRTTRRQLSHPPQSIESVGPIQNAPKKGVTVLSAEERLAAILEGSPDAIFATDTRGIITD
jgi:PAS domain-containing protein